MSHATMDDERIRGPAPRFIPVEAICAAQVANPYELLGLSADATDKQIGRRVRDLSRIFSPDMHVSSEKFETKQRAEELMKLINAAKDVLLDPQKRMKLDSPLAVLRPIIESIFNCTSFEHPYAAYVRPLPGAGPTVEAWVKHGFQPLEGLYLLVDGGVQHLFLRSPNDTSVTVFNGHGNTRYVHPLKVSKPPLAERGARIVRVRLRGCSFRPEDITSASWPDVQNQVSGLAAAWAADRAQRSELYDDETGAGEGVVEGNPENKKRKRNRTRDVPSKIHRIASLDHGSAQGNFREEHAVYVDRIADQSLVVRAFRSWHLMYLQASAARRYGSAFRAFRSIMHGSQ